MSASTTNHSVGARRDDEGRPRGRRLVFAAVLVLIGAIAYAVRLSIMLRGGGLHGLGAYDDGVYYAAADSLVHGRLPYRDFLFIQAPLVTVVTAPFTVIGTLTSDGTGFAIARLAFIGIGAVNAVLCGAILRRFGWTAVLVGGIGYAVFHSAVYTERSVLLEPLGTLGALVAILLLQHAARHPSLGIVAGVAAGLATGAKATYIIPALVLLVLASGVRVRFLIGLVVGGCAIFLPFFVAAPQRMFQEVVLDQLGRAAQTPTPLVNRLVDILGVHSTVGVPAKVILPILTVLAAASLVATFLTKGARVFGVLLVADLVFLLSSSSWFLHYAALTAAPLALCVGVGAERLVRLLPVRPLKIAVVAVLVLGVVGVNEANDRQPYGVKTPAGLNLAAERVKGCITADDPGALIEMNVLSRNLKDPTCAVWPDVTGWTYDPRDSAEQADGTPVPRQLNARWQADVVRFLRSGDATIRTRSATGLSAASKAIIDSGTELYRNHRYVVHATHRP